MNKHCSLISFTCVVRTCIYFKYTTILVLTVRNTHYLYVILQEKIKDLLTATLRTINCTRSCTNQKRETRGTMISKLPMVDIPGGGSTVRLCYSRKRWVKQNPITCMPVQGKKILFQSDKATANAGPLAKQQILYNV